MEVTVIEEHEVSIDYSIDDCVFGALDAKQNLSLWIYRAYKKGDEDFNFFLEQTEISTPTAYRYIAYEEAVDTLSLPINLASAHSSTSSNKILSPAQ